MLDPIFTFAQTLNLIGLLQCVFILAIIISKATDIRKALHYRTPTYRAHERGDESFNALAHGFMAGLMDKGAGSGGTN